MHFIYYINSLRATKVDLTYLGCLTSNTQRICPVAALKRMTTGSAVSALSYRATQNQLGKNYNIRKVFTSSMDTLIVYI